MIKLFRGYLAALFVSFVLAACASTGEDSKHKAYVYKQPTADGLICIFYSNYPGIAERNAQMFVEMHEERYGVSLHVRTDSY